MSWLLPLGSNNCGSVTVSKDLILICQCHQDSIRNQSCEKYKIPSTILSKLVAHSSTENFIVVVVDRIDISKPEDEKLKLHCWSVYLPPHWVPGRGVHQPSMAPCKGKKRKGCNCKHQFSGNLHFSKTHSSFTRYLCGWMWCDSEASVDPTGGERLRGREPRLMWPGSGAQAPAGELGGCWAHIGFVNTIPWNCLWFVLGVTLCSKTGDFFRKFPFKCWGSF